MAKRPDLVDITSITNSSTIGAINQNWDRIQEAFDNTVSLDGSVPNAMTGDLDINGNAILNVGTIDAENLTLNGQTIVDLASVPEWRSAWLTATSYAVNDLVKTSGNVYICLIAHTSGTFATDLTMVKWELMVSKGDSGGGTGDLLAANNLSDVANPATARANLSLGTVATENIVPVAKGGTGAVDAAAARTALGAQAAGVTLDSLESLPLVAGDLIYATAADTLTRLPAGSAGQALIISGGVPSWSTLSTRVLLASKTASASATLDFTEFNNAVYTRYEFELDSVKPANDGVDLGLRFSTNAGSSYDGGASNYTWQMNRVTGGTNAGGGSTSTFLPVSFTNAMGNAAAEHGVSGRVTMYNAGTATVYTRVLFDTSLDDTGAGIVHYTGTGRRTIVQDTDAVRFLMSAGNIASGRIRMYGLI